MLFGLCPGPSLCFRSLEYSKWTLPALAATPMKTWLNGRGWISCTSCMFFMWFRWPLVLLVSVLCTLSNSGISLFFPPACYVIFLVLAQVLHLLVVVKVFTDRLLSNIFCCTYWCRTCSLQCVHHLSLHSTSWLALCTILFSQRSQGFRPRFTCSNCFMLFHADFDLFILNLISAAFSWNHLIKCAPL